METQELIKLLGTFITLASVDLADCKSMSFWI